MRCNPRGIPKRYGCYPRGMYHTSWVTLGMPLGLHFIPLGLHCHTSWVTSMRSKRYEKMHSKRYARCNPRGMNMQPKRPNPIPGVLPPYLLECISYLLQVSVGLHTSWVTCHTSWVALHTSWVYLLGYMPYLLEYMAYLLGHTFGSIPLGLHHTSWDASQCVTQEV